MQEADLRAWIALQRTPGISAATLRQLLNVCEHPRQLSAEQPSALALSPSVLEILRSRPDRALTSRVERDWRYIEDHEIALLTLPHPDYPLLLKETADPPPLLYVKGDIRSLHTPQIAMVGSRQCTRQGADNASAFARELAELGLTVTSGCALGIDSASHRGALASPRGRSIGVLGTGIDVIYPRRNGRLFEELRERGALVSEFPLGTRPHRALFPQRNRLISGLSLGVLVVEAALQSGSLITARFALEQNRDVFAVPGSIHNPASEGCHYLIQQGAHLVTAASDIVDALTAWLPNSQRLLFPKSLEVSTRHRVGLNQREQALVGILGYDPTGFDRLLERSGFATAELQGLLTSLELKGVIEHVQGRYQRLAAVEVE